MGCKRIFEQHNLAALSLRHPYAVPPMKNILGSTIKTHLKFSDLLAIFIVLRTNNMIELVFTVPISIDKNQHTTLVWIPINRSPWQHLIIIQLEKEWVMLILPSDSKFKWSHGNILHWNMPTFAESVAAWWQESLLKLISNFQIRSSIQPIKERKFFGPWKVLWEATYSNVGMAGEEFRINEKGKTLCL